MLLLFSFLACKNSTPAKRDRANRHVLELRTALKLEKLHQYNTFDGHGPMGIVASFLRKWYFGCLGCWVVLADPDVDTCKLRMYTYTYQKCIHERCE